MAYLQLLFVVLVSIGSRICVYGYISVLKNHHHNRIFPLLHRDHPLLNNFQNSLSFTIKSKLNAFKLSMVNSVLEANNTAVDSSTIIQNLNRLLMRCTFISVWCQGILAVISGIILIFANTVRMSNNTNIQLFWSSGFAFSMISVIISIINTYWTLCIKGLSRRITKNDIETSKILPTIRKYSKISIMFSLVGMLITLLSAEIIVGNLIQKVLFQGPILNPFQTLSPTIISSNSLQALDIFLVQANTNTLVGHFIPLVSYLFIQMNIPLIKLENNVIVKTNEELKVQES